MKKLDIDKIYSEVQNGMCPLLETDKLDELFYNIFHKNQIKECADYFVKLMKDADEIEKELRKKVKQLNSYANRNKNSMYHCHSFNGKGYYTHIYLNTKKNPFYCDALIPKTIFYYLIESELIEYVGQIIHQGTLHEAYKPKK